MTDMYLSITSDPQDDVYLITVSILPGQGRGALYVFPTKDLAESAHTLLPSVLDGYQVGTWGTEEDDPYTGTTNIARSTAGQYLIACRTEPLPLIWSNALPLWNNVPDDADGETQ